MLTCGIAAKTAKKELKAIQSQLASQEDKEEFLLKRIAALVCLGDCRAWSLHVFVIIIA